MLQIIPKAYFVRKHSFDCLQLIPKTHILINGMEKAQVLCICDFDLCFFGITYPRNGTERKTKKRFMVIGMLACILTNCGPDGL